VTRHGDPDLMRDLATLRGVLPSYIVGPNTAEAWAAFQRLAAFVEQADCPYCAGDMCARFDGLNCQHDAEERHGYPPGYWEGFPDGESS
jgi:hypothetical protein